LLDQGRQLLVAAQEVVNSAHQVNSGWEAELNIAIDTVWDIQRFLPILAERRNGLWIEYWQRLMSRFHSVSVLSN
jgi:hypothetical protein